jgi:hypothetical protein
MKYLLCFCLALLVSCSTATDIQSSQTTATIKGKSFINSSQPFLLIDDVNRQAEAWATCVAVWQIMSEVFGESKAQSDEYSNLANGAKMAIIMTHVSSAITEDNPNPQKLSSTWTLAKTLMDSMPDVILTSLMADLEARGMDAWFRDFEPTFVQCNDNLETQQMYVDSWRSLAASGLLDLK